MKVITDRVLDMEALQADVLANLKLLIYLQQKTLANQEGITLEKIEEETNLEYLKIISEINTKYEIKR